MAFTQDISETYKRAEKKFNDRSKHRVLRFDHVFKGRKYPMVIHIMEWQCGDYIKWVKSWPGVSKIELEMSFDDEA